MLPFFHPILWTGRNEEEFNSTCEKKNFANFFTRLYFLKGIRHRQTLNLGSFILENRKNGEISSVFYKKLKTGDLSFFGHFFFNGLDSREVTKVNDGIVWSV